MSLIDIDVRRASRVSPFELISAISLVVLSSSDFLRSDDWPQWGGPQRDIVWREDGIVEELPEELNVVWRQPIGAGYAGPAGSNGFVYVTDRVLEKGEKNPDNPFRRSPVQGVERILCLDEKTGKIVWQYEWECQYLVSYPSGPRATPTVADGRVYALGAMGHLFCFDAKSGKVLWKKNVIEEFDAEINVWGTSAGPLVDGENLIVLCGGRPGACVVALDRKTGKERWRALDEADPGYCPPVIIDAGGKRQLIVWTPRELASLDPSSGKKYWGQPFKLNSNLSISAPIFDAGRRLLFVTAFYNGPMMMELDASAPKATMLWKGSSNSEKKTDGLHAIMCTPVYRDEHIYGVCSYGQLRCLEIKTGKRVWETRKPTGDGRWWNAFIIPQGDRYFIANEQGELITAKLSPKGYEETSRAKLIEPTNKVQRRMVVWSHPAFANRRVYARNDKEIVCVDLAAK